MATVGFHRPAAAGSRAAGGLEVRARGWRVLSTPSQVGCPVRCSFCISRRQRQATNLSADEIVAMVMSVAAEDEACELPIELSFTGEGEPALNHRAVSQAVRVLAGDLPAIQRVRYSFSGIGATQLLGRLETTALPARLQLSLHAARQAVRDVLVPTSLPLGQIETAMRREEERFQGVDLNVVLMDGVNDTDADLHVLAGWGEGRWCIVLNPLLGDSHRPSNRVAWFEERLRRAGRQVRVHHQVARAIAAHGVHPLLAAPAFAPTVSLDWRPPSGPLATTDSHRSGESS